MANQSVLIADIQILGAAFFFGIGFLGQRAISVDGLGPMTVNAFRFGLSTILLAICLPMLPSDGPSETHEKSSDYDAEEEMENESRNSFDEEDNPESALINKNGGGFSLKTDNDIINRKSPTKYSTQSKAYPNSSSSSQYVLKKLFGNYTTYLRLIRSVKKTVWFWGLTLGVLKFLGSGFQQVI